MPGTLNRGPWAMSRPHGFSWIEKPLLAAMGRPDSLEELTWLRSQGTEVLLSLTEDPPRRDWVNDAGLMLVHVPVTDMEAPTQEQLDRCLSAIARANQQNMGVAVHCTAGLGRTGVVLACYFVDQGLSAQNAIARVRRLRPGSIETEEQAEAVEDFARRRGKG
jgi:atypical dual specificity phosphatase